MQRHKIPDFLFAKYDSVELKGSGGQGRVYRCERNGVVTAAKVLNELSDEDSRRRFNQEIEIAKSLDHPHIVKLLDAGENDGLYWYESEFATESTFGELAGYLFYDDLERVRYFRQICRGVLALHEANIIHRDIKPSNILAFRSDQQGEVTLKVADFGLSVIAGASPRLTRTGDALGTGDYMAPER